MSSRKNKTKQKTTTKGHGSMLEETRPDHVVSSTVTATKLPLSRIILKMKMKNKKEKCGFLKMRSGFNALYRAYHNKKVKVSGTSKGTYRVCRLITKKHTKY